jgi:hypothetical protein
MKRMLDGSLVVWLVIIFCSCILSFMECMNMCVLGLMEYMDMCCGNAVQESGALSSVCMLVGSLMIIFC